MNTRNLPVRLLQALALITVLCAASPLAAQPVSDTTRVARTGFIKPSFLPATAIQGNSPGITTLGPRLGPQFTSTQPVLAQGNTQQQVSAMAQTGGNHTIVISTLALVLGVIVIVLLVS